MSNLQNAAEVVKQHTADADCAGQINEAGECTGCGVGHADPCPVCKAAAFHAPGCPEVFDRSSYEYLIAQASWSFVARILADEVNQ